MDRLHLTTNHHARPLLCGPDVPAHVIAPGGDLDWAADSIGASFFCYRGDWYHLSAFMRLDADGDLKKAGFHGAAAGSAWTGTAVRMVDMDDGPGVVVASFRYGA
tara:strand:- start:137 stop:451 length:315 start_codon:yes stop_codon:yes gene_type:complete